MCSTLKVNRRFEETRHFHLEGRKLSQARNHYKTRSKQIEAKCSFDRSVDFQGTTRRYIPEDRTIR
jgi:hypothetical protein